MDWAQILVIILVVFLAVFLLLGIILVAMFIRLTRQIKNVTDAAQRTAESLEHVTSRFSSITSLTYVVKKAVGFAEKMKKRKKRNKKGER